MLTLFNLVVLAVLVGMIIYFKSKKSGGWALGGDDEE
jgi:hypothetical protein